MAGGRAGLHGDVRKDPGLCYPDVTGATEIVEAALRAQLA